MCGCVGVFGGGRERGGGRGRGGTSSKVQEVVDSCVLDRGTSCTLPSYSIIDNIPGTLIIFTSTVNLKTLFDFRDYTDQKN